MPITLELMPLEPKPVEPPPPKTMVVRYGYLRLIGEFASDVTGKTGCGTKLVLRTNRGTEIGEMLTTACGNGGCSKSITRDKLLEYIDLSGGRDYPFYTDGRVLRMATAQDLANQQRLDEQRSKHLTQARELVTIHRLEMKIVAVEHLLGGERIILYFTAEHRIDFRSLVRDLAHQLHSRIELHQVGARDEARITADYEKCGQHCCCKQFLKVLTPISMRAAKTQKATLDPAKISGRCGRLMCCLRYEDQTYEELRKRLPRKFSRVRTSEGEAWVMDGQILTQLVLVQYDNGKQNAVPMEHIEAFDLPKPKLPNGKTMQTPFDAPPPPDAPGRAGPRGPRQQPNASAPAGQQLGKPPQPQRPGQAPHEGQPPRQGPPNRPQAQNRPPLQAGPTSANEPPIAPALQTPAAQPTPESVEQPKVHPSGPLPNAAADAAPPLPPNPADAPPPPPDVTPRSSI
ncbi:MAG: hypothetical protein HKL96_07325 [Phycisphaerales bacterium]|nr:hypothetical protein [Phycisphaerales bacterium]